VDDGVQLLRLVQVLARIGHLLDDPGEELLAVGPDGDLVEKLPDGGDPRANAEGKPQGAEELDQLGPRAGEAGGRGGGLAGPRASRNDVGEGTEGLCGEHAHGGCLAGIPRYLIIPDPPNGLAVRTPASQRDQKKLPGMTVKMAPAPPRREGSRG